MNNGRQWSGLSRKAEIVRISPVLRVSSAVDRRIFSVAFQRLPTLPLGVQSHPVSVKKNILIEEEKLMSSEGEAQCRQAAIPDRRHLGGGCRGVVGAAVPFVGSWNPSAKAKAAGALVKADLSKLEPGQMVVVEWRGKPVFVVRRTKRGAGPADEDGCRAGRPGRRGHLPAARSRSSRPYRSIEPEYLVVLGVCTHLGCSPKFRPELAPADLGADWKGGFFCPLSRLALRPVGPGLQGVPAPTNLEVPPYSSRSVIK